MLYPLEGWEGGEHCRGNDYYRRRSTPLRTSPPSLPSGGQGGGIERKNTPRPLARAGVGPSSAYVHRLGAEPKNRVHLTLARQVSLF